MLYNSNISNNLTSSSNSIISNDSIRQLLVNSTSSSNDSISDNISITSSNNSTTIPPSNTISNLLSTVDNNLTATIANIRSNVTRVLYMYFHNVTDEFGYGAATTQPTTTTAATTAATITTTAAATAATTMRATSAAAAALAANSRENAVDYVLYSAEVATGVGVSAGAWQAQATNLTTTAAAAAAGANSVTALASTAATAAASAALNATATLRTATTATTTHVLTTAPSIIYPNYPIAIRSQENCTALFANYTQPQQGSFCNWTWDQFLCWPPTPAGVLARMHCPSGWHGIDTRKFANRKCELDGHWGSRPNETYNPAGWTDYQPCFKPEVTELLHQMKNLDMFLEIAKRTRTLEIVGLILSLFALILSLIIFCNFRTLRNNRTKIHKNLFIAMVLQVLVRLTLYLDQAFRRGQQETTTNTSTPGIENTPYLCEASYVLLEYARTAMFMWMFIEGLYLHNMVTVAVFQGRFPHTIFSLIGWGMPVLMTTIWAICTAAYMDSVACWWNYNLTTYYWILEGPRLIVILLNFFFLMNIIRVLVVKLRQSQASDIEQTRKAVRAAIVLLPLLGITNLLHLVPTLNTPWKFALWSYVTHFLTSFQGFFIALIYCFLNGEVRAVLLKSLAVYMSVRGHPEWAPKRASMFSGAYNTAPDTEAQAQLDGKRNDSPPNKRNNGRKASATLLQHNSTAAGASPRTHISSSSMRHNTRRRSSNQQNHNNNINFGGGGSGGRSSWLLTLCFRGHKVLRPPASSVPPESVVFELSEQ